MRDHDSNQKVRLRYEVLTCQQHSKRERDQADTDRQRLAAQTAEDNRNGPSTQQRRCQTKTEARERVIPLDESGVECRLLDEHRHLRRQVGIQLFVGEPGQAYANVLDLIKGIPVLLNVLATAKETFPRVRCRS